MGMDLYGKGGYFQWTLGGWSRVLQTALDHGWEPEGTRAGPNELRRLRYRLRKAGKTAAQIDRAMKTERNKRGSLYWSNDCQMVTARDATKLAEAIELSMKGNPDKVLKKFAKFCRAGSFEIC